MLRKYGQFLRKSLYSLPEDIERPYHKVANLTIKITSVAIVTVGAWLMYHALETYFVEFRSSYLQTYSQSAQQGSVHQSQNSLIPPFPSEATNKKMGDLNLMFYDIVFTFLGGAGLVIFASGLGPVLLLRYIAFTLPDRIYLRAHASPEERERKKRGSHHIHKAMSGK